MCDKDGIDLLLKEECIERCEEIKDMTKEIKKLENILKKTSLPDDIDVKKIQEEIDGMYVSVEERVIELQVLSK